MRGNLRHDNGNNPGHFGVQSILNYRALSCMNHRYSECKMQKKNITKFKAEYCHVFLLFKLFCNLHLYLFLRKVIIPTFVKKYRQSKWNHLSRPDLCGATTRSEIPNLSIAARCWLSLGRVSLVLVAGFSITNVISQQNGKSPN